MFHSRWGVNGARKYAGLDEPHRSTLENLAPQDHFLRKLDAALDLSFAYKEMAALYSLRRKRSK